MPYLYRPDDLTLDSTHMLWRVSPDARPQRLSANAAERPLPGGPSRQTIEWLRLPGGASCRLDRISRHGVTTGWLASHRLAPGTDIATAVVARAPAGHALAVVVSPPAPDIGPGFFAGTLVATDEGEVPVDWLRPGDRLLTRDNGYCALHRVTRHRLPPTAPPTVSIAAGTLGPGLPAHTLRLSAAHGVLLASGLFDLHFGTSEMLADAGDLPSVPVAPIRDDVPFYQLAFADHQIVLANGLWVETLLPSRMPEQADSSADISAQRDEAPLTSARPRLRSWEVRMFDVVKVLAAERAAA